MGPGEAASLIPFGYNAGDIAARVAPYADAGLEYVVLANLSGLVGGLAEVHARAPEFGALVRLLRGLDARPVD